SEVREVDPLQVLHAEQIETGRRELLDRVAVLILLIVEEDVRADVAEPTLLREEVNAAAAVDLAESDLRHEPEIGAELVAEVAEVAEIVVLRLEAIGAEGDGVRLQRPAVP